MKGKKEIEYNGQLSLNTTNLSNEEMQKLLPVINEYKVTYDNEKIMILKTGIRYEETR